LSCIKLRCGRDLTIYTQMGRKKVPNVYCSRLCNDFKRAPSNLISKRVQKEHRAISLPVCTLTKFLDRSVCVCAFNLDPVREARKIGSEPFKLARLPFALFNKHISTEW